VKKIGKKIQTILNKKNIKKGEQKDKKQYWARKEIRDGYKFNSI